MHAGPATAARYKTVTVDWLIDLIEKAANYVQLYKLHTKHFGYIYIFFFNLSLLFLSLSLYLSLCTNLYLSIALPFFTPFVQSLPFSPFSDLG